MEALKCNMSQEGILGNLRKGLDNEKRAIVICSKLLNLVSDEEDIDDLNKIIKDETKHIKITNELIDLVNNEYQA